MPLRESEFEDLELLIKDRRYSDAVVKAKLMGISAGETSLHFLFQLIASNMQAAQALPRKKKVFLELATGYLLAARMQFKKVQTRT